MTTCSHELCENDAMITNPLCYDHWYIDRRQIKTGSKECQTFELVDDAVYIELKTGHVIYIDQSMPNEIDVSAWFQDGTDSVIFEQIIQNKPND